MNLEKCTPDVVKDVKDSYIAMLKAQQGVLPDSIAVDVECVELVGGAARTAPGGLWRARTWAGGLCPSRHLLRARGPRPPPRRKSHEPTARAAARFSQSPPSPFQKRRRALLANGIELHISFTFEGVRTSEAGQSASCCPCTDGCDKNGLCCQLAMLQYSGNITGLTMSEDTGAKQGPGEEEGWCVCEQRVCGHACVAGDDGVSTPF
jgi:hypothetical protein